MKHGSVQLKRPSRRFRQGIIDAAVNGGHTNFREAFFTAEFSAQNPDMAQHVAQLRVLIQEQVSLGAGAEHVA